MFRLLAYLVILGHFQLEVGSNIPAGTWRHVINHRFEDIYLTHDITDIVPTMKPKEEFFESTTGNNLSFRKSNASEDEELEKKEELEQESTTEDTSTKSSVTIVPSGPTFKPNTLDDP